MTPLAMVSLAIMVAVVLSVVLLTADGGALAIGHFVQAMALLPSDFAIGPGAHLSAVNVGPPLLKAGRFDRSQSPRLQALRNALLLVGLACVDDDGGDGRFDNRYRGRYRRLGEGSPRKDQGRSSENQCLEHVMFLWVGMEKLHAPIERHHSHRVHCTPVKCCERL